MLHRLTLILIIAATVTAERYTKLKETKVRILYCTDSQMLETVEKKLANLPLINIEINITKKNC